MVRYQHGAHASDNPNIPNRMPNRKATTIVVDYLFIFHGKSFALEKFTASLQILRVDCNTLTVFRSLSVVQIELAFRNHYNFFLSLSFYMIFWVSISFEGLFSHMCTFSLRFVILLLVLLSVVNKKKTGHSGLKKPTAKKWCVYNMHPEEITTHQKNVHASTFTHIPCVR